jgi:hypothetical protein
MRLPRPCRLEVLVRARLFASAVVLLALVSAPRAQGPAGPEPVDLPVRRVVLYKSGVGYFEHLGSIAGTTDVAIQFTSRQLDDVLKSLTAIDLDHGRIASISYNSVAPVSQRLEALRLPLGPNPDMLRFYTAMRGARVEVRTGASTVEGRLLNVERRTRTHDGSSEPVDVLTVVSDAGAVRPVVLDADVTVRFLDREVRDELARYLAVVSSERDQDVRRMILSDSGTGTRRLFVSYVSEVPIWKSTYRLVLPEKPSERPLLQGWAIVDNTAGEDWTNVELSLVAGAPHSFIQQISQPYYARRPVVPLPPAVLLAPQTHEPTLERGRDGGSGGGVFDQASVAAKADRAGIVGGVAGGVPASPPLSEAIRVSAAAPAAVAQDLGDLFEYRLRERVTIRKNQSALVPILSAPVEAERVSLWSRTPGNGRPLRAVWLTNASGLTLDGGTFSVIDANSFAGEGLVEPLKPGERRLISYATDLGVMVDARLDDSSGRYTRIVAQHGALVAWREERNRWVYRVHNEDTSPRTIVIEHPVRRGWTLAADPAPVETTVSAARFRLPVEAKKDAMLAVSERRTIDARFSIGEVDESQLATIFDQQGAPADALRRALQPLFDKRAEVVAADRRLASLQDSAKTIAADQQRLRENMKALRGSDGEKALTARYTRELNAQEDRLGELRAEMREAAAQRDARRSELSRLVEQLTFEIPGR